MTGLSKLLKIASLAKIAWTARDKFHAIWRRNGGYAKESTPWFKASTPGLTPQIETKVLGKLTGKSALQDKYLDLLEQRSKKQYTGNNIGKQFIKNA